METRKIIVLVLAVPETAGDTWFQRELLVSAY
jgi:hypothetical protein